MTFDWDDLTESNNRLDLLHELKAINPGFRCTAFAVPSLGSDAFWASVPDWVELAVHGWDHHSVYECAEWGYDVMADRMLGVHPRFVDGFKAPGWQISNDCYRWLFDNGWWVADQHLEDQRRPEGLRTFFYEDGNYHGHIQNVCGNGLEEDWETVVRLVRDCDRFLFASENLT